MPEDQQSRDLFTATPAIFRPKMRPSLVSLPSEQVSLHNLLGQEALPEAWEAVPLNDGSGDYCAPCPAPCPALAQSFPRLCNFTEVHVIAQPCFVNVHVAAFAQITGTQSIT